MGGNTFCVGEYLLWRMPGSRTIEVFANMDIYVSERVGVCTVVRDVHGIRYLIYDLCSLMKRYCTICVAFFTLIKLT